MKLIKDNSYKLVLKVNDNTLTYICKVTDDDGILISFIDKFNKAYTYNKNLIMSVEELE